MKRRAYIGLSGPLAFDYKNTGDLYHKDDVSAPNPILEDSMGLLLFYDEIIFLCAQLCPFNMRELDFVKFLNESDNFEEKYVSASGKAKIEISENPEAFKYKPGDWAHYFATIESITGNVKGEFYRTNAKFLPDNHTHQFQISSLVSARASSLCMELMCIDLKTIGEFSLENCDLIYNSGNSKFINEFSTYSTSSKDYITIGQHLIVNHLPNYLTKEGPYHECLMELRKHSFVESFRRQLDSLVSDGTVSDHKAMALRMEKLAHKYRDDFFSKYLEGENHYFTIGKAAATEALGLVVPGSGFLTSMFKEVKKEGQREKIKWAGFVVDIPKRLNE